MISNSELKEDLSGIAVKYKNLLIDNNDFYLQKACDAWLKWKDYKVEPQLLTQLLALPFKRDYKAFSELADKNPVVSEIKDLIFSLIAYCDVHAKDKKVLNGYPDNRVVAKCLVRQNAFILSFLKYKQDPTSLAPSVKFICNYLDDPEHHLPIVSEGDRIAQSVYFLGMDYDEETFEQDLIEKFNQLAGFQCRNPKNSTYAYALMIYGEEKKETWREGVDSRSKNHIIDSGCNVDKCWYVGAVVDEIDHTNEWIKKGIWTHGYPDGNNICNAVNKIEKGDKIAIKSTYTMRKNLPFDINGKTASIMSIKATGTVVENMHNGRDLKVVWDNVFDVHKLWFFFTARKTVWEVYRKPDDWMYGALLDFTFLDIQQNYEKFLSSPFWQAEYKMTPTIGANINQVESVPEVYDAKVDKYTEDDFLKDVFISQEQYHMLCQSLEFKMNIILEGAPGVGKTFAAKRLAYSMMGYKDDSRIAMVQFHQSYTYEDFVLGYRPDGEGFSLQEGIFHKFCNLAAKNPGNKYFFIIDEINRGNLSKIFGELLMLIERGYRGSKISLAYDRDNPFCVPNNLYIIGMMNTADRSLAIMDYALRRRFAFFRMEPAFESDGFRAFQNEVDSEKFNRLISTVIKMNQAIANDDLLGDGFCIGHSYFCECKDITDSYLSFVVENEIIPLLNEYWYDEQSKIDEWSAKLRAAIK